MVWIPRAPTGLAAVAITNNRVGLTWTPDTYQTGQVIQRSLDGVTYTVLANVAANTVSFTDSNVLALTTYYYKV